MTYPPDWVSESVQWEIFSAIASDLQKKQQLWQIYLCYVSQVVVNFGRCMQKLLV